MLFQPRSRKADPAALPVHEASMRFLAPVVTGSVTAGGQP